MQILSGVLAQKSCCKLADTDNLDVFEQLLYCTARHFSDSSDVQKPVSRDKVISIKFLVHSQLLESLSPDRAVMLLFIVLGSD